MKSRPQRLEKHYLTEMTFAAGSATLRLRANLDAGANGFDVELGDEAPRVKAFRVGEGAEGPEAFDLADEDAAKLLELEEKLRAALLEAAPKRGRLQEASIDGTPFLEVADPATLIDRLVGAMTPVVREIARHSLAPTELVLKRQLGDHRREEIFVSSASLDEKLTPLSEALRAKFRPLGLATTPVPEPKVIVEEPGAITLEPRPEAESVQIEMVSAE